MTLYPNYSSARKRTSTADRLPDHSSLMMTARTIERKYNTSPAMALVVAELVSTSLVDRR
jgi:hypothetical protein